MSRFTHPVPHYRWSWMARDVPRRETLALHPLRFGFRGHAEAEACPPCCSVGKVWHQGGDGQRRCREEARQITS
jgi:hypothetical protein